MMHTNAKIIACKMQRHIGQLHIYEDKWLLFQAFDYREKSGSCFQE